MEYAARRKLRLADYDYSQPGAYFITVCTKDKKCLLSTIVGADDHIGPQATPSVGADAYIGPQVRLTRIGQIAEKYLQSIPGVGEYVIMPNHVHMILHIAAKDPADGPMWGSDPSAAGGRSSEGSKWQRSADDAGVRAKETAGHRNRTSAPTAWDGNGPMWSSAPTERDVSVSIRTWKTLIAKELGVGIWQRSYYDHIIRDEADYMIRVQYIRENPAKWCQDDYYTW